MTHRSLASSVTRKFPTGTDTHGTQLTHLTALVLRCGGRGTPWQRCAWAGLHGIMALEPLQSGYVSKFTGLRIPTLTSQGDRFLMRGLSGRVARASLHLPSRNLNANNFKLDCRRDL